MTDDEARKLVEEGLHDLRAAFDLFDVDGNGRLDAAELTGALRRLGQRVGVGEAERLIASVSRTRSIGFLEFVRLIEPVPPGLDPEAEVREAFDLLDIDHDGFISGTDLSSAVRRAHEGDASEVAVIVRAADTDGDGRISYDEFRELLLTER